MAHRQQDSHQLLAIFEGASLREGWLVLGRGLTAVVVFIRKRTWNIKLKPLMRLALDKGASLIEMPRASHKPYRFEYLGSTAARTSDVPERVHIHSLTCLA